MKHREKITQGWEPWLTPLIPALRKLMEEISEFEASIGCIQDSLSYSMELYQQKMVLTDCWCGRAWLVVGSTTPGSEPELCRKASWAGACKQSSPGLCLSSCPDFLSDALWPASWNETFPPRVASFMLFIPTAADGKQGQPSTGIYHWFKHIRAEEMPETAVWTGPEWQSWK